MKIIDAFKKFDFRWLSVATVTVFTIFVYLFMEWAFIVTKPSFMSSMKFLQSFWIFLTSAAFLSSIYLAFVTLVALLSRKLSTHWCKVLKFLSILIPGVLTASLIFLLIDNFTYTVLRYGIASSRGIFRALYGVFFLFLIYISTKEITKWIPKTETIQQKIDPKRKRFIIAGCVSFILLAGFLPVILDLTNNRPQQISENSQKYPHIFLITTDGVNAENMSLYGYERETTPFLEELGKTSIVGQNAFTNSAKTTGSIISMFTSKHPIETKVLYSENILTSEDAYQHLPAILKQNGYTTAQYGFGKFINAYHQNVKNGFDEVNGESNTSSILNRINQWVPNNTGYFLYECGNRIYDRLKHIYFIKLMTNPVIDVSTPENFDDFSKLNSILDLIDTSDKPVFVHLHWMGTHGDDFFPRTQVFSIDKDPGTQTPWDPDFYDDSILEFDQAIKLFYDELTQKGLIDNSIIIIASDHGQQWITDHRLPLLIWFPEGEFNQSIKANVQNMDIAPTLLDYLGIDTLQWMDGSSLLEEVPEDRLIFAVGFGNEEVEESKILDQTVEPPSYPFGHASVIICDTWYQINFSNFTWSEKTIEGYVGECNDPPPSQKQVLQLFVEFFQSNGYDASSLIGIVE